ncbi:MAG: sensor histidine kinase [Granulosicoccus sp.]|nr:sensor histidine kinase [Granulosicoccus sp.]
MNSLERNLRIGLIASLVIILFVFWWTISLTSRLLTDSYVFTRLEKEARHIASLVSQGSRDNYDQFFMDQTSDHWITSQLLDPDYHEPASGRYFAIAHDDGRLILSRSAWDQELERPRLQPGQSRRLTQLGASGTPVLNWLGGYSIADHSFTISVAQDIGPIVGKLRVFHWFAAALATLLLLTLLGVLHRVMKRSKERLEMIRHDMQRLEQGRIVALSEDVPAEISPLVHEFNQLLRRFDQRLKQSRNAVGNLAHSLKGPLNLLLRSTEATGINDQQKNEISQHVEHIRRLLDSELKRARLAGRGAGGSRFDIMAELPAMIGLLEQVYSDKNMKIRCEAKSGVELPQDRQDMLELIGNLLDNAAKWCRSLVLITIQREGGVSIDVEDDGPGCSPQVLSQLTGRGVRVDESVAGHGLGLSIVKDIVDSYDGQVKLQPSTRLGGLKASIFLPERL